MNMISPCGIGLPQGDLFMLKEYEVTIGDRHVGEAQVSQQGLYYQIKVRCLLDGEIMHKLLLRCNGKEENLGVLVPVDGMFGIDTRIQIKKIGAGEMRFVVLPRHRELQGKFVPLSPEEPFRYITRLKDSYLERRSGVMGIIIKEPGHG